MFNLNEVESFRALVSDMEVESLCERKDTLQRLVNRLQTELEQAQQDCFEVEAQIEESINESLKDDSDLAYDFAHEVQYV